MNFKVLASVKCWFLRKAAGFFEPTPPEIHIQSLREEIKRRLEDSLRAQRLEHELSSLRISYNNAERTITSLERQLRELKAHKECKGNG